MLGPPKKMGLYPRLNYVKNNEVKFFFVLERHKNFLGWKKRTQESKLLPEI